MRSALLCTTLLGVVAAASTARADYLTSYTVTLDIGQQVTNIMILERSGDGRSVTWAFSADGDGTTTINNPFPTPEPRDQSLLIGIVQGLETDENPLEKHVVLLMDDTAAQLSNHIAWGTLFRNTLEEQLIADIELATSGQDWEIIMPGLEAVDTFGQGDADTGILGPGGVPQSAWFATGGTFSVMTWSDGALIGAGVSESVFVPEPATLATLVVLGGLAFRRRRSQH